MGLIKSLFQAARATATASAMAAERAKYKKLMTIINEATAKHYATSEAIFAARASDLNISDAAARVAREPDVIAAANAIDDLRKRLFDALLSPNPDHELVLTAQLIPGVIDTFGKILGLAYVRVLFVPGETGIIRDKDSDQHLLEVKATAVRPSKDNRTELEFVGRVERVFDVGGGEVLSLLVGQERTFKRQDIVDGALKLLG